MKTKKKQVDADFIYLVKIARTKKALDSSNPIPCESWIFWDKNYRIKKTGVAISTFTSEKEAKQAIDRELRLLKREGKQFKRDVSIIQRNGMEKRYPGILRFLCSHISSYALGKPPVFKIVHPNKERWESLWE